MPARRQVLDADVVPSTHREGGMGCVWGKSNFVNIST
jgi:hypothetical protein